MGDSADSAEPRSGFARDGYVVLKGWLDQPGLDQVRSLVAAELSAEVEESCIRPNNTLVPLRWTNPLVTTALGEPDNIERLRRAIGGTDLRWISGYVSVKDPHSPPLWWHQDWWCWDHPVSLRRASSQVAVLCYLSDTDATNGALRVLPGSHARSSSLHAELPEAHADEATALDTDHIAMRDHPGQVTVAVKAGDAVVTDYRLLHGTHANATGQRRDCILLSFTPNWQGLPLDVRGHLVRHPALPRPDEAIPAHGLDASLLPVHSGPRADLWLNRNAPVAFVADGT
jgi:hypothetical protein